MSDIEITKLGGAQDVGRRCVLLCMGDEKKRNILLDCGIHLGYNDDRRFPDFSHILSAASITQHIDCVIITNYRSDYCGALPYLTEVLGYSGPIYMTNPTKAIVPHILEGMRKDHQPFYTSSEIENCMQKVTGLTLHQNVSVDSGLEIKPYYAAIVLGAAMFWIRVDTKSVVYATDYTMRQEGYLVEAWIDRCRPDLLISECIYPVKQGNDERRAIKKTFLKMVVECIENGGKVLIPAFAFDTILQLCIMLHQLCERRKIKCPMYLAANQYVEANSYLQMLLTWINQPIRKTFANVNKFDLTHIKPYHANKIDEPGPMVVFAMPGTLDDGQSQKILANWAPNPKNMVIIPDSYYSGSTVYKLLSGVKELKLSTYGTVDVNMSAKHVPFQFHSDLEEILDLSEACQNKHLMLVSGEAKAKTLLLSKFYMAAIGVTIAIQTSVGIATNISFDVLRMGPRIPGSPRSNYAESRLLHGVAVIEDGSITIQNLPAVLKRIGMKRHTVRFTSYAKLEISQPLNKTFKEFVSVLRQRLKDWPVRVKADTMTITVESVEIKVENDVENAKMKNFEITWTNQDESLGSYILQLLHDTF